MDDRTAHGDEEDHSGPLVAELLAEAGFVVDGAVVVSADEIEIRNALNTAVIGGSTWSYRWAEPGSRHGMSLRRPPSTCWTVSSWVSPRRFVPGLVRGHPGCSGGSRGIGGNFGKHACGQYRGVSCGRT